jgi:hypothetical protein
MKSVTLAVLAALPTPTGAELTEYRPLEALFGEAALPESRQALTLSGPIATLSKVLEQLTSQPHSWSAAPVDRSGKVASVRLSWPGQFSYKDLGGILYLVQLNGLTISDTELLLQNS